MQVGNEVKRNADIFVEQILLNSTTLFQDEGFSISPKEWLSIDTSYFNAKWRGSVLRFEIHCELIQQSVTSSVSDLVDTACELNKAFLENDKIEQFRSEVWCEHNSTKGLIRYCFYLTLELAWGL